MKHTYISKYILSMLLFSMLLTSINAQEEVTSLKQRKAGALNFINDFLFSGLQYHDEKQGKSLFIPIIYEFLPLNTVEGFVTRLNLTYEQENRANETFFQVSPTLRYGFENKRLNGELSTLFFYQSEKKAYIKLSGGRNVWQINHNSNLSAFNNSFATYAQKRNFLKIYQRQFIEIQHSFALAKDLLFTNTTSWEDRIPLENLEKYRDDEDYTSNDPSNNELASTSFDRHQAFLVRGELRWQRDHQYKRRRGFLRSVSEYPALSLSYTASIAEVLGSDISFQKISAQLAQQVKTGQWGSVSYLVEVGDFLSSRNVRFIDYKHFNGKKTMYGRFDIGDYQLLDYYQYSTTSKYLQAHVEQLFTQFSLYQDKIIPVIQINFLQNKKEKSYVEFGIGLDQVYLNWRLDIYNSWRGGEHESIGIRFGVVLN